MSEDPPGPERAPAWRRFAAILGRALELPEERRAGFLDRACAGEPELRREIESLLSSAASDTAATGTALSSTASPGPLAEPGRDATIGPYRIVEQIGEGGMGTVYLAEQQKPIRRRVALKLIKWGMDTRQVVARFESERQALALMSHPNVARVLDAGATAQGRPFFAMEYVPGLPITQHCDRHRLTLRERLELFQQVCDGVQHAHQKGLIHRDIKPSNVLVHVDGERRTPKIIDFGVAKATQQRLTERTVLTELGQLIGTPEYMSPEQADLTVEDIDTRTDVYSLGVLLYELLVGALPFETTTLRRAGFDEIRRIIREQDPPRPSARFSTLGDDSGEQARRRRTDSRTMLRSLRGDLDWIVMRALEKDRVRRYATAIELGREVGRYLQNEPVLAGPPGAAYRLGKFVRRHRVGSLAALLVSVALLLGAGGTAWQAWKATLARDEARRQATVAESASAFLADVLKSATPSRAEGDELTVAELLERATRQVEEAPPPEPLVEAQIHETLAEVYYTRGANDRLVHHSGRALDLLRSTRGPHHRDTLTALANHGVMLHAAGRREDGLAAVEQGVETYLRIHGSDPGAWPLMNNLAALLNDLGRPGESREWALRVLADQRRLLARDDVELGYTLHALALSAGSFEEKARYQEQAVEILRQALGVEHQDTLHAMIHLGRWLRVSGQAEQAETSLRDALEAAERVLPEDHPLIGTVLHDLLWTFTWSERPDEAEGYLRRCLNIFRLKRPRCDAGTADAFLRLAEFLDGAGRQDEMIEVLEQALAHFEGCDPAGLDQFRQRLDRPGRAESP